MGIGKTMLWILALLVVVGGGIFLYMNMKGGETNLELRITDLPSNQQIGSLILELENVQVNSDSKGWITIKDEPMSFDLIKLIGSDALIGGADLEPGHYNQIRMDVKSAQATINAQVYPVTIPSKEIKLIRGFDIVEGKKLILTLDFDAKNSLLLNENNQGYKLRPTVKVIAENVDCLADTDCPDFNATQMCGNLVRCMEKKCGIVNVICQQQQSPCQLAGGTVQTASCCNSASDFPNTCLVGACGCAPEESHQVSVCECLANQCFDGSQCVYKNI